MSSDPDGLGWMDGPDGLTRPGDELSEISGRLAERYRKRYLDWNVPDPAGQSRTEIRRIRDELDLLVTELLAYLNLDTQSAPDETRGTPT